MRSEQVKNLHFLRRACDKFVIDLNLIIIEVNLKTVETQEGTGLLRLRDTAKNRLDTGDNLTRGEWLNNIVVRSEFETENSIDLFSFSGKDYYGR